MMLDETEASGGKLAVSREEFFADYDTPNKISIAVANECFDILVDLKPLTIINESGRGFIISDNPVTLYNLLYARRNYRINYGLGTGGTIIFLPLSPTVCFCLCDPRGKIYPSSAVYRLTFPTLFCIVCMGGYLPALRLKSLRAVFAFTEVRK